MKLKLRHLEWVLVAVLALRVLALHAINLGHAGGLWRDEANTAVVASLPSLGAVWHALPFESFPLLPFLVVRWWGILFGPNDASLRMLGMLIGLGTFEILWRIAREAGSRTPVLSLALLGLNTLVIRWGDSLRGYGLGMMFILLTFHLVWQVTEAPSRRRIIGAMVAAVLSVQTLYSNAFLIAAICLAGFALCGLERQWKRAALILAIGFTAAVSLWPYVNVISEAKNVNLAQRMVLEPQRIWKMFGEILGSPLPWIKWVWVGLWFLTAGVGVYFCAVKYRRRGRAGRQAVYSLTVLWGSTTAFSCFIWLAHLRTSPWYYLILMAVWVACMEMMLGVIKPVPRPENLAADADGKVSEQKLPFKAGTVIRIVLGAILLVSALFLPSGKDLKTRMTNLDLVAAMLQKNAQKDDLIIIPPWFMSVSFQRYYAGTTPWSTVPPMPGQVIHRYDLLRAQIMQADKNAPMRPLLQKCVQTLGSGHRVWLVGRLPTPSIELERKALRYNLKDPHIWDKGSVVSGSYEFMWANQLCSLLVDHSIHSKKLPPLTDMEISPMECLDVFMIDGWHDK